MTFLTILKGTSPFYVGWYLKSLNALEQYHRDVPHLHYINYWGIAESLRDPLLLSSIKTTDDENTIKKKLDYTARYIETFTVRRAINYKKFGQTSIRYTMFNLIKAIRDNELNKLCKKLSDEIDNIDQQWDMIADFGLHGQNRKFVKHLLSRISGYVDELIGKNSNYVDYHHPKGWPAPGSAYT